MTSTSWSFLSVAESKHLIMESAVTASSQCKWRIWNVSFFTDRFSSPYQNQDLCTQQLFPLVPLVQIVSQDSLYFALLSKLRIYVHFCMTQQLTFTVTVQWGLSLIAWEVLIPVALEESKCSPNYEFLLSKKGGHVCGYVESVFFFCSNCVIWTKSFPLTVGEQDVADWHKWFFLHRI